MTPCLAPARFLAPLALALVPWVLAQSAIAQTYVILTNTNANSYTQNFDSLGTATITNAISATTGVQTALGSAVNAGLNGWHAAKIGGTGTAATPITANNGSFSSGGLANYGSTNAPANNNRSLGGLSSGSTVPGFGALIVNETGRTLTGVQISFTAKFWRSSTSAQNVLTFGYGVVDGTTVTTNNFLTASGASPLAAANIVGPAPVTSNGPLDGNDPANQSVVSSLTIPQALSPGAAMYIRWQDANEAGNDAGLAVDDLSLTALAGAPPATAPFVAPVTIPPLGITRTQAGANSEVTGDGGAPITARGFVFSVSSVNPSPTLGGTGVSNAPDALAQVGPMAGTLTGLIASTTYAVRSYASNAVGTTYSSVTTFTTPDAPIAFSGNYSQSFATYTGTVPTGWSAISSSNSSAYGGDWGTGSSAGFRGVGATTGNVLGYQHAASTGTLTVSVTFVNSASASLDALNISYLGRTALPANTRTPEWIVSLNGTAVDSLAYSTGNTDGVGGAPADLTKSAQLTGLGIAPGAEFTITWVSERGAGTGSSRQIGLADFSISAVDPTAPTIGVDPATITTLAAVSGQPGAAQSFQVSGSNLTGNLTVTAPANFEVSTTSATTGFSSTATITASGTLAATEVWVRIAQGAAEGAVGPANVEVSGGGATTRNVSVSGNVTAPLAPTLSATPSTLSLGSTTQGLSGIASPISVSGSNLAGNVIVTAPAGFELSADSSPGAIYSSSATLTPVSGTLNATNVWVRLTGASVGAQSGNVAVASTGATTQNVAVDGTVTVPPPSLALTGPLTTFATVERVASAAQSFTVQGSNLTTSVTVSASGNLEFTTNTNSAYSNSLDLPLSGNALSNTVFARIPTNAPIGGPTTNTITAASGVTNTTLSAVTLVASNTTPWIVVNPTNLSGFGTSEGAPSAAQTFTATGTNLTADLVVTPPSGFELSTNGAPYTSAPISFAPVGASAGGVVASDSSTNAAYGGGWTSGANGGTGFGPWVVTASNNPPIYYAGAFIGTPVAAGITGFGTNAFGLYANPAGTPATVSVDRPFLAPLKVGETFSFQWAVNWDAGGGNKGFNVYAGGTSGTQLINVNQGDFPGDITFNGANAVTNFGTAPMTWSFTMVSDTILSVTSTGRDGSTNVVFSTNIAVSGPPDAARWYTTAMTAGDQRQSYFDNLQIAALATGGIVPPQTISARIAGSTAATNSLTGDVNVTSTGAQSRTVALSGSVAAAGAPLVTAIPASLPAFSTLVGTPSAAQSFNAEGSNLTADVTITAPAGYEVSLAAGSGYAGSLTLPQSGGTVASTPIFVRLIGTSAGSPAGNVTVASAGATTQNVAVSGTVSVPTVTAAPSSLSGFTTLVGAPSTAQFFNASGSNLAGDIVITAPTGFEVSTNGTTFSVTVQLTPVSGAVASTQIFVRLTGASAGSPSGNVTVTSTDAATQSVAVSGTVATAPAVAATPTSLTGFNTTVGTPSTAQTFNASGSNLSANITITAPTGFEISTNGTTFSSSVTLTPVGGTVASTPISVRLTGAAAGSPSGNVTLTSTGATTQNVAVSGTVPQPAITPVPSALTGFEATRGSNSLSQTSSIVGTNFGTNRITVTNTGFYQMSTNGFVTATNFLTLAPTGGAVAVRIATNAPVTNNLSGAIIYSALGVTSNVPLSGTVTNPPPSLTALPSLLTNFSTTLGTPSTNQSFSLSGTNLTANVTVTPPTGWQVSATNTNNFSSNAITIGTNAGGAVGPLNVFLRIGVAASPISFTNVPVAVASGAVVSTNVLASGTVETPQLTADTNSLSNFTATRGSNSVAQISTVTGLNLGTNPVTVTNTGSYEMSTDSFATPGTNFLTLSPTGGAVAVRIASNAPVTNNLQGALIYSALGVTTNVALSGVVTNPPPSLTALPPSLTGFSTTLGAASANQSFGLTGTDLTNSVTVTPPPGWQVAATNATNFSSSAITIGTNAGGGVGPVDIYLRIAAASSPISFTNVPVPVASGSASTNVLVSGSVLPPLITTDTNTLTGFTATRGSNSVSQTSIATGANLGTNPITVTNTGFYEISTNGFTTPGTKFLTLSPTGGSVAVRIATNAPATNNLSGAIIYSALGVTSNVTLSGVVTNLPPRITVSTNALTGFATRVGIPSAFQSFIAAGTNLTSNITVTAPPNFAISLTNNGTGVANSLILPTNSFGSLPSRTIFVRLTGAAAGSFSNVAVGLVSGSASNAVRVSGVVSNLPPSISVSPAALTNLVTTLSNPSAFQFFLASASNLPSGLTVIAPTNFAISLTNDGTAVTNRLVMPADEFGAVAERYVFVRITGAALGTFATNIALSSGTNSKNVSVAGTVGRPVFVDSYVPPRAMFANATNTNILVNSVVRTLAGDASGRAYIGGDFNRLVRSNGATVTTNVAVRVARLLTNGAVDPGFNVGLGANASVRSMAVSGTNIFVGGYFTTFAGSSRVALAKVNTAGKLDTTFNALINASATPNPAFVQSILVQPDGNVLIGGSFGSIGGQPRGNLVRLRPNGSLDSTFNASVDGTVNTIARQADGKILIGGSFSSVNGVASRRIARLNANGTRDASFNVGAGSSSGFDATVQSISVAPSGTIYVAGNFTAFQLNPWWRYLAQLDSTGGIVAPFNYLGGLNGPANRVVAVPGTEEAMVVGAFGSVANSYLSLPPTPVGRVAQLLKSGTLTAFNAGLAGANGPIFDAVLLPGGNWLLAGSFTTFNGVARSGLAMLRGPTVVTKSAVPTSSARAGTAVANTPLLAGVPLDALAGSDVRSVRTEALSAWLLDRSAGSSLFLHLNAAKNPATSSSYLYSAEFSTDQRNWTTNGVVRVFEDPARVTFRAPYSLDQRPGQYLRLKVLAP